MAENNEKAGGISEGAGDSTGPQFALQKIYIKDISFESPDPASFFSKQNFAPEINLQLNAESKLIKEQIYEVVLNLTVTAKDQEESKTAYLVELKQAGIFTLANFPKQELAAMLNSFCPNILFPYARETISNLVERGGFPQLLLAPINFEALYKQHLEKVKTASEAVSDVKH